MTLKRRGIQNLVRREAILHLQDGQTSIKGFVMEFYDDSVLVAKPTLLTDDPTGDRALGGEALVFRNEIKFIQLTGPGG